MSVQKGNGPDATNDRPAKIHTAYATDFIAAYAVTASSTASFNVFPCHGIGKAGKGAKKGCATVLSTPAMGPVLENIVIGTEAFTHALSWVFSRLEFKDGLIFQGVYGFRRDGLVRKAGRMAVPMFSTSRHPLLLKKQRVVLQSCTGAETMTTVNTHPTPTPGNPSPLTRQQAIETALSDALHLVRNGEIHSATGRAIRAASLLKQACAELQIGRAA
jgi:hypothetical protein